MAVRLFSDTTCGRAYNNFWDHRDITYESGEVTEPVTVQELKDRLRLEGFVDDDESPAESLSDFNFDDDLLADCIKAARETIEEQCGLSLVPKTIEAMVTNLIGGQEILYGPVNSVISLENENGVALTSYRTLGIQWLRLMTPMYKNMKITYSAGYTTVPAPIKMDIMKLSVYIYMHPGDMDEQSHFAAKLIGASKYSRKTWLA